MKQELPTILHHKYSLEDGHVAQQITGVEGYQGVVVTDKSKEHREDTPFTSVLSLNTIRQHPDVLKRTNVVGVHVHHGTLASKFTFLKETYGLPLFVSFRGNDATAYPKKKDNLKKLKELFQTADLFFPVCEHLKQRIIRLGCPEEKIRVLYGGLNLERFEFRKREINDKDIIRFLAVGRFVEKKGFIPLLHAFAKVRKQHKAVRLTLIGRGPDEKVYKQLIKKLGLGSSVKIIPWVDYQTIQKKYYNSHIFCAPSCTDQNGNQEGIPNTLKEAMATGMPVISTTHAGIPELVEHKLSGLLVPEGSVKELANAMNWLIEHPDRWEQLGKHAREKIETDFNLAIQLQKQKQFYDEILLK